MNAVEEQVTHSEVTDPFLKEHLDRVRNFYSVRKQGLGRTTIFSPFRRMVNDLLTGHLRDTDKILDVGCGTGDLLSVTGNSASLGIDIAEASIQVARRNCPEKRFLIGAAEQLSSFTDEKFDKVVLSGVLDQVYDVHSILQQIAGVCSPTTRVIVTSYSKISQPFLRLAEITRLRARCPVENWLPPVEFRNLLEQSGFEVIEESSSILIPFRIPVVSTLFNRWLASLPLLRAFCLVSIISARISTPRDRGHEASVSVVIAARNEKGNIGPLLDRIPNMSSRQQVIFVEGGSSDGTFDEILRQKQIRETDGYPFEVVALQQKGKGKADAVRAGFEAADGEILIILDADISVPPEELPRFIELLRQGTCEFANGSRLVYPMEKEAMRFLNLLGNRFFGSLFTYLLGQPVRDTLCGTKAIWATDYQRIVEGRTYFGDFDPFGDFDLLFGAARLGLKIRDVPVHYKERTYGSTNISRFRHGLLLLKMSVIAAKRLKFR